MKIQRFAALSLNPALDVTLWVSGFDREYNDVLAEQCEAAGKAVNVARVFRRFGTPCRTLILAGEHNQGKYFERLDQDGVDYEALFLPGDIRENLSIVLPDGTHIRLARPGFFVDDQAVGRVLDRLEGLVEPGTMFVLAGKAPQGLTHAQFRAVGDRVRSLGGSLAVDTSSFSARELLELRPAIIKPNLGELERMTGRDLSRWEDRWKTLEKLHRQGMEDILLSMGEEGLLFSGRGERWLARVPRVPVKSVVGAGDSTLAGFLMAQAHGRDLEESVRIAASFGTASVMLDGTNPPRPEELGQVYPQVAVERL